MFENFWNDLFVKKETDAKPRVNYEKVGYVKVKRWEFPLTPEQKMQLDIMFGKGDYVR